jgi:hypothetical protein
MLPWLLLTRMGDGDLIQLDEGRSSSRGIRLNRSCLSIRLSFGGTGEHRSGRGGRAGRATGGSYGGLQWRYTNISVIRTEPSR